MFPSRAGVYLRVVFVVFLLQGFYFSTESSEWTGSLDEQTFNDFLENYKNNPAALTNHPEILKNISTKQLSDVIAGLDTTNFTYLYPMSIKGEHFSSLKGVSLEKLSLMAMRKGSLIPIPYQIDEFDETGLVYIEEHKLNKPAGTPGILDEDDELIFMFRDAELERYDAGSTEELAQGTVLGEIKLHAPDHSPRYAYLVEGNSERSDADYVKVDLERGVIETTLVKIACNPKNYFDMSEVYLKAGPYKGQNIMDNVYARVSTGVLSESLRVSLDTRDNNKAVGVAVKDGPVRATVLFKGKIYMFGIPAPFKYPVNVNFYEQAFRIPTRFTLESLNTIKYFINFFIMFVKDPKVEVAVDHHNLTGSKLTFDSAYDPEKPDQMGILDNQISEYEEMVLKQQRLPGRWIYFDSDQGWNIFFSNEMNIEAGGLFDECLDGLRIDVLYEDNLSSVAKYEKYPGTEPRIGVTVEGMPYEALALINAIRKMDFKGINNLGQLIYKIDRMGSEGKLDAFDQAANNIIARMKKKGKIKTKQDLIDLFIKDLNLLDFNIAGLPRETMNNLIRWAMCAEINEEMTDVSFYKVIHKGIELSNNEGLLIKDLRYAVSDSTLWFPGSIGEGGPEDFYKKIHSPPKFSIKMMDHIVCKE